jgi:hypothetical protein
MSIFGLPLAHLSATTSNAQQIQSSNPQPT